MKKCLVVFFVLSVFFNLPLLYSQVEIKGSLKFTPVNRGIILEDKFIISVVKNGDDIFGLAKFYGKKAKKAYEIIKFENNNWTTILPDLNFPDSPEPSLVLSNNILHVAYIDPNSGLCINKFVNNTWEIAGKLDYKNTVKYAFNKPNEVHLVNDAEDLYLLFYSTYTPYVYKLVDGNWIKIGNLKESTFYRQFYCYEGFPFLIDREFVDGKDYYFTNVFNGKNWVKISQQGEGSEYVILHDGLPYAFAKYPINPATKFNTELIISKYVNKKWTRVTTDSIYMPNSYYTIKSDSDKLQIIYFDEPFTGKLSIKEMHYKKREVINESNTQISQIHDPLIDEIVNRINKYIEVFCYDKKRSKMLFDPTSRNIMLLVADSKSTDPKHNITTYEFNIDKVKFYRINTLDGTEAGFNLMIESENLENSIEEYNPNTNEKIGDHFAFYLDFYISEIADKLVSDFQLLKTIK
jgi:hypothetical protein